jgi:hypothetical protein
MGAGRHGTPRRGGRRGVGSVQIDLHHVLHVVLDLPELAKPTPDLTGQLRETLRADDQQRDDEDDEELWGSDVQHRDVRKG